MIIFICCKTQLWNIFNYGFYEMYFTYHKFHPFTLYCSVTLQILRVVRSSQSHFRIFSTPPKIHISRQSSFLLPCTSPPTQPHGTIAPLSVSMDMPVPDINGIIQYVAFYGWILSPSLMFFHQSSPCCSMFLWLNYICNSF